MNFFDCNCMLGPTATNREKPFDSADALLAEMDRVGIAESLVYSSLAYQAHPADGNERIIKDVSGFDRLHPCWVLLPPATDELPKPDKLIMEIRDANVRAVRIFPMAHKFPFARIVFGELLEALEEERIPIFVDTGRSHWSEIKLDWEEVFAICETFEKLPVVLIREGGTTQRILYGQWKHHPNLYLETSYLQVPECLDYISQKFGAERLLFGTNMPGHDPGGPMAMLELSHLSPTQREQIAGNNLRRLLRLPESQPTSPTKYKYRIFDAHGHLGLWEPVYCPVGTIDETVAVMDRFNIEKFAISDFLAIGPDYYAGNMRAGEAVKKYPDRIVGYAVYNPNYESKMEDEMKRCFDELGLTAIKLHCGTHAVSVEDRCYRKAFSIANEHHAPVLVHGSPSAEFLRQLFSDYPNFHFILAHVGGSTIGGMGQMIEVAREFPNLIFDLAASVCYRGFLTWLVNQIGSYQIVYGSDFPIMGFGWQLGRVLHASISEQDKQNILFDNANRIFSADSNLTMLDFPVAEVARLRVGLQLEPISNRYYSEKLLSKNFSNRRYRIF